MTKPPRMIDVFGQGTPKHRDRSDANATKDTSPVVMGEPMALDMTAVRRSRRHKPMLAQDGSMIVMGEPFPIDFSAIRRTIPAPTPKTKRNPR